MDVRLHSINYVLTITVLSKSNYLFTWVVIFEHLDVQFREKITLVWFNTLHIWMCEKYIFYKVDIWTFHSNLTYKLILVSHSAVFDICFFFVPWNAKWIIRIHKEHLMSILDQTFSIGSPLVTPSKHEYFCWPAIKTITEKSIKK